MITWQDLGNTPAYAGKTLHLVPVRQGSWKHPRVCGEDCIRLTCRLPQWETPPRMRGRLRLVRLNVRIVEKHPRVCGEDLMPWAVS